MGEFKRPVPPRAPGKIGMKKGRGELPPAEIAASETKHLMATAAAGQCPPCECPVEVECIGGHTARKMPCHEAKEFSCGRPCGRLLPCGNHCCQRECHRYLCCVCWMLLSFLLLWNSMITKGNMAYMGHLSSQGEKVTLCHVMAMQGHQISEGIYNKKTKYKK